VRSQGRRARRDSLPRSDRGIQGGRGAAPPLLTSLNPREWKAFAHRSAGQSDYGHPQTSLLLERPSPSRPPLSEAGSSSRAFAFEVTFAGVPSGHDGPRRDPRSQHLPTLTVMSKPTNARECQTSVSPLGLTREAAHVAARNQSTTGVARRVRSARLPELARPAHRERTPLPAERTRGRKAVSTWLIDRSAIAPCACWRSRGRGVRCSAIPAADPWLARVRRKGVC
jgi:hypothetical protein